MTTDQLARISRRATIKAYKLRHEDMRRPEAEQRARAWERLAVAANALRALRTRPAEHADDPKRDT